MNRDDIIAIMAAIIYANLPRIDSGDEAVTYATAIYGIAHNNH